MSDLPLKCCTKCGNEYPATGEFFRLHCGKIEQPCRDCHAQANREWRTLNPDKIKAYNPTPESKERAKVYARIRYETHREQELERSKRWKQANKKRVKEIDKQYRLRNRHRIRQRSKEYARQHPEYRAKQKLRHQVKTPDKRKAYKNNYKARKRELPATFTAEQWRHCIEYWNYSCAICGRPQGLWHSLAADHWIPITSPVCPGTVVDNILPLCHGIDGCNNNKSNRQPIEWLVEKLGKRKSSKKLAEIQAYFAVVKAKTEGR